MIHIFSDGAAKGNPGIGGYGVIIKYNDRQKELSQGYRLTTNNRMELIGVIVALEAIRKSEIPIRVYSDSKYVVNAIEEKWLWKWEKKGFKKTANVDLWKRYIPLHRKFRPSFMWIKGHAGHPENERCDQLAVLATRSDNLLVDAEYENSVVQKKESNRLLF